MRAFAALRESAMSRFGIKITVIVLAALLSATGYAVAKGGGGGHGGGRGGGHGAHAGGGHRGGPVGRAHVGGGRHAIGRSANVRSRTFAVHPMRAGAVGRPLNSRALARSWGSTAALRNPAVRAQMAAGAAMAGWAYGRAGSGWWQHGNGGYGWVGPLFWPFAYFDIYDYAIWGNSVGAPFWGYGYGDIYAGMFAPYGYDDLIGYLPPRAAVPGGPYAATSPLAQMCGDDSRDIAGLPIDLIEQAIEPTETQRGALDEFAAASIKAAQSIKAACPTRISLTAPGRLASMQQRIEAMIAAVATVQPALDKFYGLLDDEQKARLNALGDDQRGRVVARSRNVALAQSCDMTQSAALRWPAEEIEARLHPTDPQRVSLAALQSAGGKAADTLAASCRSEGAATTPARLAVVAKRLDTMLQAVKSVRAALDDFYKALSDEQKAQFETIGPLRTASSDRSNALPGFSRRQYR